MKDLQCFKSPRQFRGKRLLEVENNSTLNDSIESTYQPRQVLGSGFDVLRASTSAAALKPFEISSKHVTNASLYYHSVVDEHEMREELDASVKGDYNLSGVKIGFAASYLHKVRASAKSFSIVAKYLVRRTGYSLADAGAYELTEEARRVFEEEGQKKFQEKYGQYFAAGYKLGASFVAVYKCTASKKSQLDNFKSKLSASEPELFSVEGAAAFTRAARESGVEIEFSIEMNGIEKDNTPPYEKFDPNTVIMVLNWFKENHSETPQETLYWSYSHVIPEYINTIDVRPRVFSTVKQIYENYWAIKFMDSSLPSYYRKQKHRAFSDVTNGIEASHDRFLVDDTLMNEYFRSSTVLLEEYQSLFELQRLYFQIKGKLANRKTAEPATGVIVKEPTSGSSWYGMTEFDSRISSKVSVETSNIYKGEEFLSLVNKTKEWSDGQKVILGWRLTSNKDHNGDWRKTTKGDATLSSKIGLFFESNTYRAINYTLKIYTINKDLFMFGEDADAI